MPYRDNVPVLDFSGIHTVSICGDNGNGKSAIIDAMTWALWGETRAKRDDDLINQGQDDMEVEFSFTVNEQDYRIIRKHSRPKRRGASGQSALNLQIQTENGSRSIDGDTMSQTQQKIIDILHMDYNTFTNSAYLRQGHADEFTTSSPAKRKQVLVNILGLTYYDEFETQAKDIVKQRDMLKTQLQTAIADIHKELEQKPDSEAALQNTQLELTRIDLLLKEKESILDVLRQRKELLESKKAQLIQLEKNISERTRTLTQWQEQIKQLQSRINEQEVLIARRPEIEDGYLRFVEIRELNDKLNKNLSLVNKLNQRHYEVEMFIERESQTLTKEHTLVQSKVTELKKAFNELPRLKEEAQQLQGQLQYLTAEEEILSKRRAANQQMTAQILSLESDKSRLDKESVEIEEKLTLLITQSDKATCPVCQTELGIDGLKHISNHYNTEKQSKAASIKSIAATINQKKAESKVEELDISQIEKKLSRDKTQVLSRTGALEREINHAEEAGRELSDKTSQLEQIEEHLARKDFAIAQREIIKQISTELADINYDPQKHEQTRQELNELQKYEIPKLKLEEADRLIDQEKGDVNRFESAVTELDSGLKSDSQRASELSSELNVLPQVSNDLIQVESEFKKLVIQQRQVQEEIGSIKGKLEYYTRRETEKSDKENQLNTVVKEIEICHELAEAFGKKGIQALLIETALPEIETEANYLLARMTDNRMHVKIETQKETQKGDVVETLEIKISDELGTRNYEMYSGGEAFRINFAIRIALSRLLARRAGAPLPTLIIDEGFGTQDASGIEKLKEAINSIQEDFEKIIVITHVEELRDAFPARIDVLKTTNGATISLN